MEKRIFSRRKHTMGVRVADAFAVIVAGGVVAGVLYVGFSHLV